MCELNVRSIKRASIFLSLFFLLHPLSADELWNRAVRQYTANTNWVAGRTESFSETYNKKGVLRSSERRIVQALPGSQGTETVILYVEKDGKDVTEEERKKAEEGRRRAERNRDEDDSGFPNPFDPERQNAVVFECTGETVRDGDSLLIGYKFQLKTDETTSYVGTVLLDSTSGVPVEIEATMDPLPRFAEFIRLNVRFRNDGDRWYATRMELEGAGGWLFVYRHFKSVISFTDYFRS